MTPRRRRLAVAGGGAFLLAAVLAVLRSDLPAEILVLSDPVETADAAVVMAGDPGYERTATAARLYREGWVRLVILTGGEEGPGDSASSLAEKAKGWGVPGAAIRMEEVSRGTWESVRAVAPLLEAEGVRSVVLVTSPYHQRRAYRAARRAWPEVRILNHPAAPSHWSPEGWWRQGAGRRVVVGEWLKLLYYLSRGWA